MKEELGEEMGVCGWGRKAAHSKTHGARIHTARRYWNTARARLFALFAYLCLRQEHDSAAVAPHPSSTGWPQASPN